MLISFSFGIEMSIVRLSTVINLLFTFINDSLGFAFLLGLIFWVVSFVFALISIKIDAYSKKEDTRNKLFWEEDNEQEFHWKNTKKLGWSFWMLTINWACYLASFLTFNSISSGLLKVEFKLDNFWILYTIIIYF